MSKIRINELARELEVKPNVILEMLPELGVSDKKTHSSSLEDDVVLEVRRRLAGAGGNGGNGAGPGSASEPHAAVEHLAPPQAHVEPVQEPSRPQPVAKIDTAPSHEAPHHAPSHPAPSRPEPARPELGRPEAI